MSSFTLIKLCYTKALERSSLAPGPEAKTSSEITNPTSFSVICTTFQEGKEKNEIGTSNASFPLTIFFKRKSLMVGRLYKRYASRHFPSNLRTITSTMSLLASSPHVFSSICVMVRWTLLNLFSN